MRMDQLCYMFTDLCFNSIYIYIVTIAIKAPAVSKTGFNKNKKTYYLQIYKQIFNACNVTQLVYLLS